MLLNHPTSIFHPSLELDKDGRYSCLSDEIKMNEWVGLFVYSETNGRWNVEPINYPLPMSFVYGMDYRLSSNSGYGLIQSILGRGNEYAHKYLTIIDANADYSGLDNAIVVPKGETEVALCLPLSELVGETTDIKISDVAEEFGKNYLDIENAMLSPDGRFALLLLNGQTDGMYYMLLELETLNLRAVDAPESLKTIAQIYGSNAGKYPRGGVWFNGNRMIFNGSDHITIYSLHWT